MAGSCSTRGPFDEANSPRAFRRLVALPLQGQAVPTLRIDYSDPGLTPSNWTLVIHPDGSRHFHADGRRSCPAGWTMQPVPSIATSTSTRVLRTMSFVPSTVASS